MVLLGGLKKGLVFILSAPAGTGKTTLVDMLKVEFPSVVTSISSTTRKPRQGEVNGVHYNFISVEEFELKIASGEFLEHVRLYDDYYGTSLAQVQAQLEQRKHVFLVIDTQGAMQLKKKSKAVYIFVQPPSLEALQERLEKRKTEDPETIKKRLKWAENEIQAGKYYDYQIVNDDLKVAYQILRSIVIAEEHRVINLLNNGVYNGF